MFESRWWEDRLMDWSMSDESIKVQLFRFVDVLPMLRDHEAITRHLQEYFEEAKEHVPRAARLGLQVAQPNAILSRAVAYNARMNARRMAGRFIAGSTPEEVLRSVKKLRDRGFAWTLDLLGEAVISDDEADRYQQAYLELLEVLAPEFDRFPESPQIDHDHMGAIPRVNCSLKLSALDSHFRPIDPAGTTKRVQSRLRTILRRAMELGAFINVDMEQYAYKDLTYAIFRETLLEDEFRDWSDIGIVVQAYLRDSEDDLRELLSWARERGTPVWVRLVKGAYWDYETVIAKANDWPVPVYEQKWQSDECFERLTRLLLDNYETLRPAFGSHNLRSLAHAIAYAETKAVPQSAYELQMLYGMGMDQAQIFTEMGHRVRVYTPFGELIPGMAYLVRRLLENTSNDSFLRHSVSEDFTWEELMKNPADVGLATPPLEEAERPEFVNEPHTDFSREEHRKQMREALLDVKERLGRDYPLIVDGKSEETRGVIVSRNPSKSEEVIGKVSSATSDHAVAAIDAARRASIEWSQMEPNYRAEYLELIARKMRERRLELAAWQVYECGKPWAEADADVAEAIDFCIYYALQVRTLAGPFEVNIPGEANTYSYRPRGVVVVIAPWNFPLAILTGMTVAALVTGNTVVMKPAEQSSVMAAKFMEILLEIGLPDGVVNFLPGIGEEIGPDLVGSPEIDMIAFTGSRDVGLEINRQAADTEDRQNSVKRVIAEMGGKNAIIIDDDADLDEAVLGVVGSAFGYSGQKCSACSRAIVLASVYDQFVQRLKAAVESLQIGPADDPGTQVGPVIDAEAVEKIKEYIELGHEEGELLASVDASEFEGVGSYVAPHVFVNVSPEARIAQEEIFGPVLCVLKVRDLSEAFRVANNTKFALTGAIFSRSPKNLARARNEFQVGNLYLNRGCTGAMVHRQPFGGFRMSGVGTKAGGPDYLQEFVVPVNVTENTMRRGFAPEEE